MTGYVEGIADALENIIEVEEAEPLLIRVNQEYAQGLKDEIMSEGGWMDGMDTIFGIPLRVDGDLYDDGKEKIVIDAHKDGYTSRFHCIMLTNKLKEELPTV